jgi:hypothetical protein
LHSLAGPSNVSNNQPPPEAPTSDLTDE